jgi:hypothetical protein
MGCEKQHELVTDVMSVHLSTRHTVVDSIPRAHSSRLSASFVCQHGSEGLA